jgi:hypothetical protein
MRPKKELKDREVGDFQLATSRDRNLAIDSRRPRGRSGGGGAPHSVTLGTIWFASLM